MRRRRVGVRALRATVRFWIPRLWLSGWTIRVGLGDCGGDVAECHARPEYREADLTFNLANLDPDALDETVRHELLHCHTWGLWSAAHDAARSEAGRELARREHEGLTTVLARITGQIPAE